MRVLGAARVRSDGGIGGRPKIVIAPGDRIPEVALRRFGPYGVEEILTATLFAGRRAVLFGVPGAFTPVCSNEHLPGFVARAEELAGRGVDRIACMAVNDPFVMEAWGRLHGAGERVLMLADATGELTRALGLELDLSEIGLGIRCRRFAAVLDDGVFRHVAIEPGRGITVCGAEHLLDRFDAAPF